MGSSTVNAQRAAVSTSVKKLEPKIAQIGISRLKFGPTKARPIWGITRPIQPTKPQTDTLEAVISVAAMMARRLTLGAEQRRIRKGNEENRYEKSHQWENQTENRVAFCDDDGPDIDRLFRKRRPGASTK